jgi:hypothetical protein
MFSLCLSFNSSQFSRASWIYLENLVYQRCSTIPNVRSSQLHMGILVVYLVFWQHRTQCYIELVAPVYCFPERTKWVGPAFNCLLRRISCILQVVFACTSTVKIKGLLNRPKMAIPNQLQMTFIQIWINIIYRYTFALSVTVFLLEFWATLEEEDYEWRLGR